MPDHGFSVHVDQDDLTEHDFAAALSRSPRGLPEQATAREVSHHGARDARQAARGRPERDHARAGSTGKGRSYAFRRS